MLLSAWSEPSGQHSSVMSHRTIRLLKYQWLSQFLLLPPLLIPPPPSPSWHWLHLARMHKAVMHGWLGVKNWLSIYSPFHVLPAPPQRGAVDAEIKVPFGENTELKRSPFQGWSRSVYSHTYYAYCQGFLPCLSQPFRSIRLHFFPNLSWFLLCWLC